MVPSPLPSDRVDPAPNRLSADHPVYAQIVTAHRRALEAGEDGYLDPLTGLWVFTAGYLWDRGFCCDRGCRHCPYVDR